MDYVFVLVLVGSIAVGVVAAVVRTWALHSRCYSLEDRVGILEGTLTREVKTRAAQERWAKPSKDKELLDQLKATADAPPAPRYNFWERAIQAKVK